MWLARPISIFSGSLLASLSVVAGGCSNAGKESASVSLEVAALHETSCLNCHSDREMQRGPILDGLPAWYLEHQMAAFAEGIRGQNPENRSEALMGSVRETLLDAETREQLATLTASRDRIIAPSGIKGDLASARSLWSQRCASCHGADGQGNAPLAAPPVAQLEGWYALDQLRKFASGQRGSHPADLPGKVMAQAVYGLTDRNFVDLAAYIDSLATQSSAK